MSAPGLPATGRAAAENELLARLGLPPSAAPEDIDQLHEAASAYLAAAPASIRGWAHAQAAALDQAYLQLTDPVGLQGSALRSPTRPPRVDPGGPVTPPARREVLPATPPAPLVDDAEDIAATDDEDTLEALYASVTPSAHADMGPDRQRAKARKPAVRAVAAPVTAPAMAPARGPWRRVVLAGVGAAMVLGVAFASYTLGGGGGTPAASDGTGAAAPSAPAIDEAKVADLMAKVQANPNDTATLLALANEFYAGEQYQVAGTWLDKLLALDPNNIDALLARGAVSFNLGDLASAETTWQKVVTLDPKNAEVHWDLGFLYLNQPSPDLAGVQREWNTVIELNPSSQLAQNARSHLDALARASMLPAESAVPSTSPAASDGPSPAASPAASAPASPAASSQP
jgi:tetratricopeptide (TPR) repeat protein